MPGRGYKSILNHYLGTMSHTYSLQAIIENYELLGHEDPAVREGANLFLMGLTFADDAWKITEVPPPPRSK